MVKHDMDDPSNRHDHWNINNIFHLEFDFENYVVKKGTFRELLSVGCYLEIYPFRVGSLAARVSWATRITWLNYPRKY